MNGTVSNFETSAQQRKLTTKQRDGQPDEREYLQAVAPTKLNFNYILKLGSIFIIPHDF